MAMSLPEEIRLETNPQIGESLNASSGQKLRVGGFPEEIFEDLSQTEKDSLFCNICLNLVNQCQQCSNSHFFCKSCIFVWTQVSSANSTKCPVCRSPQADYVSVPEADQQLVNKEVSCPVENCTFKSSLRLFLLHAHGKNMYCNEQNDYDKFKAENRSTNERLADENERFVDLVAFIERFNIVQSLLSFESLMGNNRSLALMNVLHEIMGMSNRRDSAEPGATQVMMDISLPMALAGSRGRSAAAAHLPGNGDGSRIDTSSSGGSTSDQPSSGGAEGHLRRLSFDRVLDNISLSTRSSLFDSLPGSGRNSDSSSLLSTSTDDSSFDFQAFYRAMSDQLESDSSEDEAPQLTRESNLPEDFLISSASTDTLVDNCTMNEDIYARNINFGNNANGSSTFNETAMPTASFTLDDNDSDSDSNVDELSMIDDDQCDPPAKHSEYETARPGPSSGGAKLLPSRISALPLVTSRKSSRISANRDVGGPMQSHMSLRSNAFTAPYTQNPRRSVEFRKPATSSSKLSLANERPPGHLLRFEKAKSGPTAAAEPSVRRHNDALATARPQPSKPLPRTSKEVLQSPNVTRLSKQASSHKFGETPKRSSRYKPEAFKLPSIYAPSANSRPARTPGPSKLPKVSVETADPPGIKKGHSKTSFSGIGKNKY